MTIANNYAPVRQIGNGSTTAFSAAWSMLTAAAAVVTLEDATTHALTLLNQGAGANQYTIVITSSGFTVTLNTAPTSSQYVNISRSTSLDQSTPYATSKGFQGQVEEASFDKLTAINQENANLLSRNISVPVGDSAALQLPQATVRASQYLSFDSSGNVITSPGPSGGVSISTPMIPVVQASTLAVARTALGVPGLADNNTLSGNNVLSAVSMNGGPLAGLRNLTINGRMAIDQRNAGASQTITAGAGAAYTVDRFYATCTGANVAGKRVAGSGASQYAYQFTGAASVTGIAFGQRYEAANVWHLASTTASFSVKLANSLLTTVTWTAYYPGSADNWGSRTQIATGTFTVNSTPTVYGAQIALPSNVQTGLEIELSVGAQVSGTWTITDWMLEAGTKNTPIENDRPLGLELSLCQRYYWQTGSAILLYNYAAGGGASAPQFVPNPVFMRAVPTVAATFSSLGNCTGGSVSAQSTHGFMIIAAAAAAGNFNATCNAGCTVSAEL